MNDPGTATARYDPDHGHPSTEERVLVLAPTGRDAALIERVLGQAGLLVRRADGIRALCDGIRGGAAAAILAAEALDEPALPLLRESLARQPPWSDLPIVLLAHEALPGERLGHGVQVTRVERPVRVATLVSVVESALRARRRQYEVRDLLHALEETDRRKDQFLAMLGHELRNPLAAIETATSLLDDPTMDEGGTDQAREVITRQTRNLTRIVDDLLDVSRVTRGKVSLRWEQVPLRPLVRRAVEAHRNAADERELSLRFEGGGADIEAQADPVRMEQVVSNLVGNAIKYTQRGGSVAVRLGSEDDEAVLRVVDDGVGIPADMLPRVFDAFTQVDGSTHRSNGGLGLGLPVVKSLVELHGGEVRAFSEGEGRGSEFVVRVPRTSGRKTEASDDGRRREAARASDATVLLVDDDEDIRLLLSSLLRRWGYRVETARNGREGLDAIERVRPDIALVDIGMPVMDGYAMAKRLQEWPVRGRPTLVAMTGYGQPDDRRRAMDAGFVRHLVKPVNASDLADVLNEVLASGQRS